MKIRIEKLGNSEISEGQQTNQEMTVNKIGNTK